MATYNQSILESIKSKINLSEQIAKYVKLTRKGHEFIGLCPFHKEKTPSFTVSDEKNFYHCFGCQAHGNIFDFIMHQEGLSFPEAVETIASQVGVDLSMISNNNILNNKELYIQYENLDKAKNWFMKNLHSEEGFFAKKYLNERGINDEIINKFSLGFAPDSASRIKKALSSEGVSENQMFKIGLLVKSEKDNRPSYDRFRNRVMFPISDSNGRTIAFGGRALGQSKAKYLNSPETDLFLKGKTLYGLKEGKKSIYQKKSVIVAEGYMDVISLSSNGFTNSVASLGTALTQDQIENLWRLAPEPILCFDGDAAGRKAAILAATKAMPILRPGYSLRFAMLPEGEDPDTIIKLFGIKNMQILLDEAISLNNLIWWKELNLVKIDSPDREAGLKSRLNNLANSIKDKIVKEAYQNDFNNKFNQEFRSNSLKYKKQNSFSEKKLYRVNDQFYSKTSNLRDLKKTPLLNEIEGLSRERFIVGIVLFYPKLIDIGFELFSNARLKNQNLDFLRTGILKATSGKNVELNELKSKLVNEGFAEEIDSLLKFIDKKFSNLVGKEYNQEVVDVWLNALNLNRRASLEKEISDAWLEFANDSSEESKEKVLYLQQELAGMQGVNTKGNLIN